MIKAKSDSPEGVEEKVKSWETEGVSPEDTETIIEAIRDTPETRVEDKVENLETQTLTSEENESVIKAIIEAPKTPVECEGVPPEDKETVETDPEFLVEHKVKQWVSEGVPPNHMEDINKILEACIQINHIKADQQEVEHRLSLLQDTIKILKAHLEKLSIQISQMEGEKQQLERRSSWMQGEIMGLVAHSEKLWGELEAELVAEKLKAKLEAEELKAERLKSDLEAEKLKSKLDNFKTLVSLFDRVANLLWK
ncbi:OLC1v1035426C1 [Oldenlandia corymbosa var. corymbosa]|uniref:OLC1v1035426C1 n=1 Tax=Oldenlandia corymbosa var. corymbosa TaxID=529605 RepID=A0AAV1CW69_OLDCO|nr:OLC1v1035426C1 [Oldenlandia corymbosa var. corymbosa]